jgi:sugar (glycoside-pentoside-hexuronide) transporter
MTKPPKSRLLLFAFGDFAFNLYWQSLMLFLLFYYSDALELPIRIAATIFMIGSVWDGIANFAAGIWVDRRQPKRGHGPLLVAGSVPLALAFLLAYLPPLAAGWWGIASVFIGHLVFRTAYAAVNVPYLAMTARITQDGGDRAIVAGLRMLFGTLAAVAVALGTVPLGEWLTGERNPVQAFLAAAALFALIGTIILVAVGASYREAAAPARPPAASVRAALASLIRNRAFVTLNVAMVGMIIAITLLNKSVLYYFKYALDDPEGGQLALASMGLISAVAVPLWLALGRFVGLKALWFLAAGPAMAMLAALSAFEVDSPAAMQGFLIAVQAMIVGLNFVFWAMLPNTIEYGERQTGLHVEGAVFGVAALLQRIAIGIATAILGWTFDSAGFIANVPQESGTLNAMRLTVTLLPLSFFALSCAAMLLNPLGRDTHGRIVRELAQRKPA